MPNLTREEICVNLVSKYYAEIMKWCPDITSKYERNTIEKLLTNLVNEAMEAGEDIGTDISAELLKNRTK